MAAGGFEGTPEEFTNAENQVTDVRVAMDQRLSTLQGEIEATRAGWTAKRLRRSTTSCSASTSRARS